MKLSISLRGQVLSETSGTAAFTGGMNDQCFAYGAPCSIQRLSSSFCSGLSAVRIGRRHHFRFVVGGDAAPEFALLGVAGDDRRDVVVFDEGGFGSVEPQVGLAGLFVEAVALEAVFGEDRADVAVEIERLLGSAAREPWAGDEGPIVIGDRCVA